MKHRILIIEDNPTFRLFVKETLGTLTDIDEAGNIREALDLIENNHYDIVLLDIHLPDGKGTDIIDKIKNKLPDTDIIMLTAYSDIPLVIKSIKQGALDYWQKPIDYNELLTKTKHLLDRKNYYENIDDIIIGNSENIKDIKSQIKKIAATDVNVLITGESGVGKNLIAETIHRFSGRKNEKFQIIDLSLLNKNLFESELFGYVKGAFSGAQENKKGFIESADGGTVLFDNIEALDTKFQGKILKLIDSKEFYPVGSAKPIKVDIRILSTMQSDPDKIKKKTIRNDLYFRLNVYNIHIEPLRKRIEDIEILARYFLKDLCIKHNKHIELEKNDMDILLAYNWNGNIRELMTIIERIVLLGNKGDILDTLEKQDYFDLKEKLKNVRMKTEKNEIIHALQITHNNKTEAAKLLKISYKNLLEKIKEYKIEL